MKITVWNPQKGRIETISVELTKENTTWFRKGCHSHDIAMITDFQGGLLISEFGYDYPVWIYEISRADIGYSQKSARQVRRMHI